MARLWSWSFIRVLWKVIKNVVFIVVLGLGVLSLLATDNSLLRLPYKPFIVLSGSMRPAISEGSVVLVERGFNNLKTGDIVTFLRPDNPLENVTHRLISEERLASGGKGYKTKGDANNVEDAWLVRQEAIWGKVVLGIPFLGFVLSFLKTKFGVISLVILPLTIIVLDEIVVIINELRRWRSRDMVRELIIKVLVAVAGLGLIFGGDKSRTLSAFTDNNTVTQNQISTSCWVPPTVPLPTQPADGAIINAIPSFSWELSVTTCPLPTTITYSLEVSSDPNFSTLVNDFNVLPDGTYYWRVRSQDNFGNSSDFSPRRSFTLDTVSPSPPKLTVTGSWTKTVEEKITNQWVTHGHVTSLPENKYLIGKTSGSNGRYVWENYLAQSFAAGAKSLVVNYDFHTLDSVFDTPGFLIRLNGQPVFFWDASLGNSGWRQWRYDLSGITTPTINLSLHAGNTGDKDYQSFVYIGKVTTEFVVAPEYATYVLSGTDVGSGVDYYQYSLDNGITWVNTEGEFNLEAGERNLLYRSVDKAGNISSSVQLTVVTDNVSPAAISDLAVVSTSANAVVLGWTAPGNDGNNNRATEYDVRYALFPINKDNFSSAVRVRNVPGPREAGSTETLEVLGLNPGERYYFAIKTADEAPNWSEISNVVEVDTLSGEEINEGDLIINELMWMGTSYKATDEFLELRNMTDREIALDNVKLTRLSNGVEVNMITSAAFAGKTIAPKGYFVIANYPADTSLLKKAPDLVSSELNLHNSTLQIRLYYNDNLIDVAGDGGKPLAGLYDSSQKRYYSMERVSTPRDGRDPLDWYTCIDKASHSEFFDSHSTGDERGTPGAENRSVNEPFITRLFDEETAVGRNTVNRNLGIKMEIIDEGRTLLVTVQGISGYRELSYELTYTFSDDKLEGVVGKVGLNGEQNTFVREIILGTCSAGGSCVYHPNPHDFRLKIILDDEEVWEYEL